MPVCVKRRIMFVKPYCKAPFHKCFWPRQTVSLWLIDRKTGQATVTKLVMTWLYAQKHIPYNLVG